MTTDIYYVDSVLIHRTPHSAVMELKAPSVFSDKSETVTRVGMSIEVMRQLRDLLNAELEAE